MPYHFEFDSTYRTLRCGLVERVTDESLTKFYRVIAECVELMDPRAGILDLSAVTSFEVSARTIHELAKSAPAMPDPSRPRIIVAASPHIFGMARIFEAAGEATRPSLHVVRTLEEAWAILGVQEPQFEPIRAFLDSSTADLNS
jgi:hypothetical protein